MRCHYCGKTLWFVSEFLDGDFCSRAHRKKFHERLKKVLDGLPPDAAPPPTPEAPAAADVRVAPPRQRELKPVMAFASLKIVAAAPPPAAPALVAAVPAPRAHLDLPRGAALRLRPRLEPLSSPISFVPPPPAAPLWAPADLYAEAQS